jgi:hypothetical protein
MATKRRKPSFNRNYPRYGSYPMQGMVRDVNRTALGIAGIGAVSLLGMGMLGALKK